MPTLTEYDIHHLYTHAEWEGDASYVPPAVETVAALAESAEVSTDKHGEFQEILLRIHRLFCDQAQQRGWTIISASRYGPNG